MEVDDADVALAPLDPSHVRPVQSRRLGERLMDVASRGRRLLVILDRFGGDYAASFSNIELRGVAWTRTRRGVLVNQTRLLRLGHLYSQRGAWPGTRRGGG